ncbi:hypothetical protein BGZ97_010574 [Linnemannia gamsii]|uniref:Uncharacterized protein n=1 Tax=Linnemannia gamsii TaxID=64522 RepID=A0A9P6R9Q6_9FUNG|nr:hypothetical protein BGZ97_010574 [Linnemannia gamsii]
MGVYGVTARSHGSKHNLHRSQRRQGSIPAHYMRLKERISRSSATNNKNSNSLANLFGPHLIISPHDRLALQKSNSVLTKPKATISLSTATRHDHYDYRICPYLFSNSLHTAATSALRHTNTGSICKPTRNTPAVKAAISRSNIGRPRALPASASRATAVPASQEEGGYEDDDEDETEDVEIDIDGVGRTVYDCGSNYTGSFPTTIPGNSAARSTFLHATATATARRSRLFGHEEFEFGTRSRSAAAAAFVFGSSQQQVPSLSSSVCSTSSNLSTPPTDLDYSFNTTAFPHHQQKDELVKLKREAFQELASQTQRFDDLFIAKMIHWESLSEEEKAQWLERGHNQHDGAAVQTGSAVQQQYRRHISAQQNPCEQHWKPCDQEQEMDDLVNALECRATVKDYSALIAFEQQAETQRRSLLEQY